MRKRCGSMLGLLIELVRRARGQPGGRSRRVARRSSGRPLVEFGFHGHTTARPWSLESTIPADQEPMRVLVIRRP